MLSNLIAILLRFRQFSCAISADDKKAFLQIEVDSSDRDVLRYLWYKETLDEALPLCKPTSYRMKRLPFGLSVSPFILCAVIKTHLKENFNLFPKTVDRIVDNIYMDDVVISVDSLEEALCVKEECIKLFNEMEMTLAKW